MSFKFEILENEDKNTLVLSSDKRYTTRELFLMMTQNQSSFP